jgi:hypothetical protein
LVCENLTILAHWTHAKASRSHAIALSIAYYNFCRTHSSLRITPAMEAGVTDHVWNIEELLS